MKTKIGTIVLLSVVLGIMVLGGDQAVQTAPVSAHGGVSAVRTEKCPDCGQAIQLKTAGHDTWEFLCPKCGEAMRTEPTSYDTLTAKCPSGDPEIRLTRVRRDAVSFNCPGCKRQMVLKCPDCGQGVLKYQRVSGESAGALCASCHKDVSVK